MTTTISTENRPATLDEILERIGAEVPGVRGSVIATTDGLLRLGRLKGGRETQSAAMAATIVGLAKSVVAEIGSGVFTQAIISSDDGHMAVFSIGGKGVLALVCDFDTNLALLNLHARRAATHLIGALV